ncbi:MAG TPA: methyltransferase domain-containing protein, partial [Cellvibrionaceae bacterium]|nr:methyltransferase domain-containing protein [Cellvibrionaceae bacterium]
SALEGARRNAELNGVAHKVTCHKGKAIEVLKNLLAEGEKFDVVVLDPPAFIKKRKDQKAGEAAYRHINELAIRLLEKEGLLVSASCSMPLENAVLTDLVRGAARANDRNAQLIWTGGQGPDHPIHPAIIETAYLKAQFFAISS